MKIYSNSKIIVLNKLVSFSIIYIAYYFLQVGAINLFNCTRFRLKLHNSKWNMLSTELDVCGKVYEDRLHFRFSSTQA